MYPYPPAPPPPPIPRERLVDPRQLGLALAVLGYGGMVGSWFLLRMDHSVESFAEGSLGTYRSTLISNRQYFHDRRWLSSFADWWLVHGIFPALIGLAVVLSAAVALPRWRHALGGLVAVATVAVLAAHLYTLATSTTTDLQVIGPRLRALSSFSILMNAEPGVWLGFASGLLLVLGGLVTMSGNRPRPAPPARVPVSVW